MPQVNSRKKTEEEFPPCNIYMFTKKIIEIFMSIYSCIVATILMQHLCFLKISYTVKMNNFYPLLTFANMKKKKSKRKYQCTRAFANLLCHKA